MGMTAQDVNYAGALPTPCILCGAPAGEPCQTVTGRPAVFPHSARVYSARGNAAGAEFSARMAHGPRVKAQRRFETIIRKDHTDEGNQS